MTAIAYREGILAADTGVWGGNVLLGSTSKLSRSPRGIIAGASGRAGICLWFAEFVRSGKIDEWLVSQKVPEHLPIETKADGDLGGIIVTPESVVWMLDDRGYLVQLDAPFYAEGGAREFMAGAMAAGATAAEAVELAIKWSDYAAGQVETLSLGTGPIAHVAV